MYHTIDDLLIEVNRVAKANTVEDLRASVTRNVLAVYKKVDAATLWQGAIEHFAINDTLTFKLPAYCLLPLDLRTGQHEWSDYSDSGMYQAGIRREAAHRDMGIGYPVNYSYNGDKFWIRTAYADFSIPRLSNVEMSGPLTLSYWRIPLAEDGTPLIDERIWDACVYYCQAEEARIGLHGRNTQSFSGVPYQVDKQLANEAIDAARAFCNKMTPAKWREFFQGFPTNHPR